VLAATAVAAACGAEMSAVAEAVRAFRGVPHRLEVVATVDGVTYVNDSIATAPERTVAGMRSFDEPLVLLLGGRDKKLPLAELAEETRRRCRAVVCFGEAGDLFATGLRDAWGGDGPALERVETLRDAVARAARLAHPGDVVLLSPAGTSFDAYPNFERRGEHFRQLVDGLRAPVGAQFIVPRFTVPPDRQTPSTQQPDRGRDQSRPYATAGDHDDPRSSSSRPTDPIALPHPQDGAP